MTQSPAAIRRIGRAPRPLFVGAVVAFAVIGACGDDDSNDGISTRRVGSSTVAAGASAADLGAAVLRLEDFGAGWQTDGVTLLPDDLEMGEPASVCPGGPVQPAPVAIASIQFETDPFSEMFVSEDVLAFGSDDDADAARDALDFCVGQEWTVEGDPDEDVILERLEVGEHGDESYGFRHLSADGYGFGSALVRLGDVLIVVGIPQPDLSEPFDAQFLEDVIAKAVARAEPVVRE